MEPTLKKAFWFLKLTAAAALMGWLVKSLGFERIRQTVLGGKAGYFLAACLLIPVFILLKTLKWHLMARQGGAQERFPTSVQAMLVGLGFGLFTPGRIGEVWRVRSYESADRVALGGLVVLDRVIDLCTILLLCLYSVSGMVGMPVLLIAAAVLLVLLFLLRHLVTIYRVLPRRWERTALYGMLRRLGMCSSALGPGQVVLYSGISLVNWIVLMVQFYFLINMYQQCTFNVILSSLPVIQLSNLIPITVGGFGVRENLSVYVMRQFSIADEVAALGAFLLYLIDIALPGMAGLALFGVGRKRERAEEQQGIRSVS